MIVAGLIGVTVITVDVGVVLTSAGLNLLVKIQTP